MAVRISSYYASFSQSTHHAQVDPFIKRIRHFLTRRVHPRKTPNDHFITDAWRVVIRQKFLVEVRVSPSIKVLHRNLEKSEVKVDFKGQPFDYSYLNSFIVD